MQDPQACASRKAARPSFRALRLGRHAPVSAFTLIEVVFSLGICSFAFVGMLGLMALGLTTLRQSMDYNTEVAIAQQLTGEAQMLDFSSITNATSAYRQNFARNRYFDDSGQELSNTTPPANYVYKVVLNVQPGQFPGMAANSPVVSEELQFQVTTPTNKSGSFYTLWTVDNGR